MSFTPRIREIHPIPYAQNGRPAFLLRDPLQLNGHMLVIPQEIAPVLYLADGTRDLETISRIFDYHYGIQVTRQDLEGILEIFDEAYLLENERSLAAHEAALDAYRARPYRKPSSAGSSYPSDPAALHRYLQDQLEAAEVEPETATVRAVLSPHIDYERGAHTYAHVWKRASKSLREAELVILIGTDHHGGNNEITLTRQHYATPFGALRTDLQVVDALAEAIGPEKAFRGELFHQHEHSLELPLVWLHHLVGGRDVPVVPILCGHLKTGSSAMKRFIEALRRETAGKKVFTVISGDLAHVGPAFGGEPLDAEGLEAIRAADHRLLSHLQAGRSAEFLAEILNDNNASNVCGTYPLYLSLQAFGYTEGYPAGYEQCPADDEGTSIVSIGGILFR